MKHPVLNSAESWFQQGFAPVSSLFNGGPTEPSRTGFSKSPSLIFGLLHARYISCNKSSEFCFPGTSFLHPSALPLTFIFGFSAPASASNHKAASGTKPKVALDPHVRLKDGKLELVSGMGPSPQSKVSSQPSPKARYAENSPLACYLLASSRSLLANKISLCEQSPHMAFLRKNRSRPFSFDSCTRVALGHVRTGPGTSVGGAVLLGFWRD